MQKGREAGPQLAPTDTADGTSVLPTELWLAIVSHVDPVWLPVTAHVCALWRALVPTDRRRLDVVATHLLWMSLSSSGPYEHVSDAILSWSLGISRASRALCRLAIPDRVDTRADGDGVAAIDDALVAAALIHDIYPSVVTFVPLQHPCAQNRDIAKARAWPAACFCSTRAIQTAARRGSTAFLEWLFGRVCSDDGIVPGAWASAVADAYATMIHLRDLDAFKALIRTRRRCDLTMLDAILDEIGVRDDGERRAWIHAATRVVCPRCWESRCTFTMSGPWRAGDQVHQTTGHCLDCLLSWRVDA